MKILAVVQARTSSTRLPRKVLLPLAGRPLLQRMLERVLAAGVPSDVVVATTVDPSDEPVVEIASAMGLACYRGHRTDLLDRHYAAARHFGADAVVKIPSDCPLIDPAVIDRVLSYYEENRRRYDFVSNLHPPSHPDGNDVEVMSTRALETAWCEAREPHEREHTTPFIWSSGRFRCGSVLWETGLDYSGSHRWTIDYEDDYRFIAAVYDELWTERRIFTLNDILEFVARRPDVAAMNARYAGTGWLYQHRGLLSVALPPERVM